MADIKVGDCVRHRERGFIGTVVRVHHTMADVRIDRNDRNDFPIGYVYGAYKSNLELINTKTMALKEKLMKGETNGN